MTTNITSIFRQDSVINSNDKITETLSKYTEKIINKDKSVIYTEIHTTYFLENDKWYIDFFGDIEQFKKQVERFKYANKNISFPFNNENINKEMKFIVYSKLFSDEWGLQSVLMNQVGFIRRLAEFINEKYPNISSFKELELELEKTNIQWIDWLSSLNIKTLSNRNQYSKIHGEDIYYKSPIANFLESVVTVFNTLTDEREEWEKDKWDFRNLDQYEINYNQSDSHYYINFSKINNLKIREEIKKYIKQRLIANNKFSGGSSMEYLVYLPPFINYICELEPTWNDLKNLQRHHILKYIEWLKIYAKKI